MYTGDTFPVGCTFDESIIHSGVMWYLKPTILTLFMLLCNASHFLWLNDAILKLQYFKENLNYNHPQYNTKFGTYSEGCSLDKITMSWEHDEYMYIVSKRKFLYMFFQIFFCNLGKLILFCNLGKLIEQRYLIEFLIFI